MERILPIGFAAFALAALWHLQHANPARNVALARAEASWCSHETKALVVIRPCGERHQQSGLA
jgi:hypothetical protein